jgi:hypothetical protein
MPRFEPDKDARITARIFETGQYEIEITGSKPFGYTKENGDDVAGVDFYSKMCGKVKNNGKLDAEFAGEDVSRNRLYVHTPGAWRMMKAWLVAAAGFAAVDEAEWNQVYDADDVTVDFEGEEEATAGKAYADVVGNRLRVTLDKSEWEGREQQNFRAPQPLP